MVTGEYYTALGIIKLNDDYEKVKNSDIEKNAAFLHEKVHFIQNFSTLYGLNNATYNLSQYLGMILKVRSGEFPISPFLPYDGEEQDFINALFSCSAGDTFAEDGQCVQCHSIQNIEEEDIYAEYYEEEFPDWRDKFKNQIILKFDDDKTYQFGGAAILESMAYLFECYFFDAKDYSHRFPYNACEMLYQFVMQEKCEQDNILIALCYASLMTMWPGNTFVELLFELKEKNRKLTSMTEVFNFASSKMLPINNLIVEELCKRIDMIFPVETKNPIAVFEKESEYTREWLKERCRYISGNEKEFRRAWVWLMEECEEQKRISALSHLLNEYGNPLIIDKNGKLYSDNDKNLVHMLAPFSLWGILMEKNGMCKLYRICKENKKNYDNECYIECWKHRTTKNICLLRYYLYKMGLGDVQFEKLKNSPFREQIGSGENGGL